MSVRNRFTIEMYMFTHSSCTFLARVAIVMEDLEGSPTEDDGSLENESRDIEGC